MHHYCYYFVPGMVRACTWRCSVVVITPDSESGNSSSNLGTASFFVPAAVPIALHGVSSTFTLPLVQQQSRNGLPLARGDAELASQFAAVMLVLSWTAPEELALHASAVMIGTG